MSSVAPRRLSAANYWLGTIEAKECTTDAANKERPVIGRVAPQTYRAQSWTASLLTCLHASYWVSRTLPLTTSTQSR